jgi:hypothetical protein
MTSIVSLDEENQHMNVVAIGIASVIIIFMAPIGIADLSYGFKQDECLSEYPHDLHLNMKTYLIVAGFLNIATCIYIICNVCYMKNLKESSVGLMVLNIILSMSLQVFYFIWNILGAIVFWSFLYPDRHCSSDVASYLFVSLVIKLVFTWMNVMSSFKKEE